MSKILYDWESNDLSLDNDFILYDINFKYLNEVKL
jgi:hypothetical protein